MSIHRTDGINRRILVIDDNRAIHEDFKKILATSLQDNAGLSALEDELFGDGEPTIPTVSFDITSAFQGRDGFELVEKMEAGGEPFAVAFVDIRMPPGWDGVETVSNIWRVSDKIQVVICTAYSDYSWEQIVEKLGRSDRLLILRKPFDPVEVQQLACNLTEKWSKL
jgi:CheY-like chemotaxis protein